MPHRTFEIDELARYLHLKREDVERLVKNQDIPAERRGGRLVFRKIEIDAWASQRILGMQGKPLADYHQSASGGLREISRSECIMPVLLRPSHIEPSLKAKTKASVLRAMTQLAEGTGLLWDRRGLLASLEAREALCSTGVPGGVAFPHPRSPDPLLFESSFIALGRTVQQVPFGALDGHQTDLFFLVCCTEDRLHLRTLARLCLMAQKTDLLEQLRSGGDPGSMFEAILSCEKAVVEERQ